MFHHEPMRPRAIHPIFVVPAKAAMTGVAVRTAILETVRSIELILPRRLSRSSPTHEWLKAREDIEQDHCN